MTCAAAAQIPDGEEIVSRMDRNRDHTSMSYTATMEIHSGDQVRRKKMKAWAAAGPERKALVEFVNAEDAGTKYLMVRDNLWIYFPEESDVVKISGHMLKEGMMGGDVSYEDALEADKLTDTYAVAVEGVEQIDGRDQYVITLEAKVRDAPYYKRKIWVDSRTYVATKEEMYAKSGKLLKVARVKETRTIDGRTIPVRTEMESKLRRDSKTVFIMHEIELDRDLDASMFTMRNLRR
jgi:outer membrane lipoprotein-sorting protein